MLPEAEVVFLDEVFLGSTAILNTLLGMLHERTFRRGKTARDVPLRVCIAASNVLPEDEALAAFADRFLLRAFVEPVGNAMLEDLLEGGDALRNNVRSGAVRASLADLDTLAEAARASSRRSARRWRTRCACCARRASRSRIDAS